MIFVYIYLIIGLLVAGFHTAAALNYPKEYRADIGITSFISRIILWPIIAWHWINKGLT